MKNWKVRLTTVLSMLTLLLAVPAPAMAQGVEDQIEGIYKGGVISCSNDVVNGFIAPEDFDRCVEDFYVLNVSSLLQGLKGTGQLTDNAEGILDGLDSTSSQLR